MEEPFPVLYAVNCVVFITGMRISSEYPSSVLSENKFVLTKIKRRIYALFEQFSANVDMTTEKLYRR